MPHLNLQRKKGSCILICLHLSQELNDQIKQWEQTYVLKSPFDGQVLLPAMGVGKVKVGSNVSIKLDDYPYAKIAWILLNRNF